VGQVGAACGLRSLIPIKAGRLCIQRKAAKWVWHERGSALGVSSWGVQMVGGWGYASPTEPFVHKVEDFAPPGHCFAVPVSPVILYGLQDRLQRHVAGAPARLKFGEIDGGTGVDVAALDAQLDRHPIRCQRLLQLGLGLTQWGCNEVAYFSEQTNHDYVTLIVSSGDAGQPLPRE